MKKRAWMCAGLCIMSGSVWAAPPEVSPEWSAYQVGQNQLRQMEDMQRYMEEQVQQRDDYLLHSPLKINEIEMESSDDEKTFPVSEIVCSPSDILTADEIRACIGTVSPEMSLKKLYAIIGRINALYQEKGYVASQAVLPPQKLENGRVQIYLVEGRYGKIIIRNMDYMDPEYIESILDISRGELVQSEKLNDALQKFNFSHSVYLEATLIAGTDLGLTDCIITVTEPPLWQTTLFADTMGSKSTGRYRTGLQIFNSNLAGHGETLYISPTWSEGTFSGMISFDTPLGYSDTHLNLMYSENEANIINGTFAPLDVTSKSRSWSAGLTVPAWQGRNSAAEWIVSYTDKTSVTEYARARVSDNDTNVWYGGLRLREYRPGAYWNGQIGVSHADGSYRLSGDKETATYYTASGMYQWYLSGGQTVAVKGSVQYSQDHTLPSSELMSAGGMYTVRGFEEGAASGSRGFVLNLEYERPLDGANRWRGLAFFDYGRLFNKYSGVSVVQALSSVGLGLTYRGNDFLGKVIVGVPLEDEGILNANSALVHAYIQKQF